MKRFGFSVMFAAVAALREDGARAAVGDDVCGGGRASRFGSSGTREELRRGAADAAVRRSVKTGVLEWQRDAELVLDSFGAAPRFLPPPRINRGFIG